MLTDVATAALAQASPTDFTTWLQAIQAGGVPGMFLLFTFLWLTGRIVRGKDLAKVEAQRDAAQAEVTRLRDLAEQTLREQTPLLAHAVDILDRTPRQGARGGR